MSELEKLSQIATVERLNADGVPSASIAILEDGEISSCMIMNGNEDTEETLYQACSISKPITALAVAKLVDEGRVSYDTKVVDHLPQRIVDCVIEPQTVHLVKHVTGYAGEPPLAEDVLAGKPPANTLKVRFDTFPGAQYSYSGGGYVLLQLFLENIMQSSFPQLMHETVLKPLDMTRSHYGGLSSAENDYATAHLKAYVEASPPYCNMIELAPAGLWTTPTDLLKDLSAIQKSLRGDNGFLTPATATQMLTQVPQTNESNAMGLGWRVEDSAFAHINGGSQDGLKVPAGHGIAIMTNETLGFAVIQNVLAALLYLRKWPRFGLLPSFGEDNNCPYAAPIDTQTDGSWTKWCGGWSGNWRLVDGDGPCIAFGGFNAMKLEAAAAPVKVYNDGKEEHIFVVDGLNVSVRLTWSADKRVVELMQEEVEILRRIEC